MRRDGFTLIELIVVMAIIATLLTIAVPRYVASVDRSKEAALRQTLSITRDAIDKYHEDTGRYPENLGELVAKRYLRKPPFDPVADSSTAWVIVPPPAETGTPGVFDLKSAASGPALDGTAFAQW